MSELHQCNGDETSTTFLLTCFVTGLLKRAANPPPLWPAGAVLNPLYVLQGGEG